MKKFLALVLALVMTMSLVTIGASAADDGFKDADKINNTEAVEVLSAMGVIGGYGDGTFRPQATLTRGAGAKFVAYLVLGQEKADKLKATYTVFSDVDDGVGLAAYIEWAAAAGIVQGYGDGRFGPYDTLTQYAFGKMLLAALGYDATEEGYVGAGWQKNVYTDAFAAGIYDGTESYTSCDRETAARFALGALKAEIVAYGKVANLWYKDGAISDLLDSFFNDGNIHQALTNFGIVTKEGAVGTGVALWENYKDLDYYDDDERDIFGRPGHGWTYGDDFSKFYMDEAVAEYTTEVSVCDILVDCGYAKTSKDTVAVDYWVDGAVFSHKNAAKYNHFESVTIDSTTKSCADKIGGQGTLTQVFEVDEDQFIVTEIHTYLAAVDSVKDTTHKNDGKTEMTVWYATASTKAANAKLDDVVVSDNIGYDKYDAVLVNIGNAAPDFWAVENQYNASSTKAKELAEAQAGAEKGEVALVVVGAPTVIENAKYDGVYTNKSQAHVAGNWENVAYMYSMSDSELTKEQAEKKESFDFFVDQYGNLIGDQNPEAAVNYGVIANVKWVNTTDDFDNEYALFQIVGADASINKLAVDQYNSKDLKNAAHGSAAAITGANPTVSSEQEDNGVYYAEAQFYGVVKSYSKDNVVAVNEADDAVKGTATFTNGDGNVSGLDAKVNNNTIFLVKTKVDNKAVYTSYTGISELPTIKLATAVAVTEDGDTYASFVYIDATNAIFAGSSVLAVVLETKDKYFLSGDKYGYTVYINGEEATNIAVDGKNFDGEKDELFKDGAGVYKLEYNAAGKLIKATRESSAYIFAVEADFGEVEGGQLKINDKAYNIANTAVYKLTYAENGTVDSSAPWNCVTAVSVGELKDIDNATFIVAKANADDTNVLDYVWVWVEG